MHKTGCFFLLLILFSVGGYAQSANDNCASALMLCPDTPAAANTTAATAECPGADGDCTQPLAGGCYTSKATLWFSFTTNAAGGSASVALSNISCGSGGTLQAMLIAATAPCDTSSYTVLDCFKDSTSGYILQRSDLAPGTRYWVQVNDSAAGGPQCTFNITVTGDAVAITYDLDVKDVVCNQSKGSAAVQNVSGGEAPYQYSLNGGAGQAEGTFSDLGAGDYAVTVTDNNGCTASKSFSIKETNNTLEIDAGEDQTILPGGSAALSATTTLDSVRWRPVAGLSDTTIKNPIASPAATTQYFITAYTAEGCSITDFVTVFVTPRITIFNTFTPNGDEFNDSWKILNIEHYPDCKVSIFNRWGQRVFYSRGYAEEWQGISLGKPLPVSTYFYVIDLNTDAPDKELEIFKGPVTIVR